MSTRLVPSPLTTARIKTMTVLRRSRHSCVPIFDFEFESDDNVPWQGRHIYQQHSLNTQFWFSPSMARHSSRSFSMDRRWASSIVAEDPVADDDHDDYDDDTYEPEEEMVAEMFHEEKEETLKQHTTKKKKLTKRQKRKQSLAGEANISNNNNDMPLDINFLHFQSAGDDDDQSIRELEDEFDRLAFVHDLSKFKWISLLEKSLVLKLRQEEEKAAAKKKETDRVRDYWKVALKAAGNKKKVPDELKDHFLSRMVAGAAQAQPDPSIMTTSDSENDPNHNNNDNDNADSVGIVGDDINSIAAIVGDEIGSIAEDKADALLLARGRELAVDHPLLWRRFSAKERKIRVRKSKNLLKKRAAAIATNLDANANANTDDANCLALDPDEIALLAAVEEKSTSLDFYLRHVRIPALNRLHHLEKNDDQREREALEIQQLLKQRLPETSYQKIIALMQTYVNCFGPPSNVDWENGASSGDDDDERLVTLETSPFTPTQTSLEDSSHRIAGESITKKQKQKQKQFRVLLSNLRKALPQGRLHWIGKDVADFFYVTTPDEVDRKADQDAISSDPVLGHSETNWKDVRDQYVQSFRNIQILFLELEREQELQRKFLEGSSSLSSPSALPEMDEFLDPNDDPSSERSVLKTFDTVAALSRMDAKQSTTQRLKPRTYIPLEAMAIGDSWKNSSGPAMDNLIESQTNESADDTNIIADGATPSTVFINETFPLQPPIDRLVVIDNLPIDATEFRLREVYGRCGDIEAIEMFHSRPDLDPGRRATDSAKKIRSPSSSSRRQKWSRPRTPLYAMILYKDETGAKKASCDPLRLFGMVLDQHLLRSHRASDMTTLYLEDVPSSVHTVSSLEFELSRLLQQSDLYVCLDDHHHLNLRTKVGGVGKKKKKQNNQLLSYTIRFPSFEAAYWSYWKLSLELQLMGETNSPSMYHLGGPALHWMETPRDSHLYWTRKLNF